MKQAVLSACHRSRKLLALTALTTLAAAACGDDGGTPAAFPPDYAATFQEVRNCRRSLDHDLKYIRVMASPDAVGPYMGRDEPFPVGAIVVKEQYGEDDDSCAGDIVDFTAMIKLEPGADPGGLDWQWQKATASFEVVEDSILRCTSCHALCGVEPDGYDGTCAAAP